jgi:ferredoxin
MERNGYNSIEDLRGIIVDKVVTDSAKFEQRIPQKVGGPPPPNEVVLDERKCIDCGWCEAGCMFLAIEIGEGLPRVDRKKCETCGMCVELCPVGALAMRPIQN